MTFSNSKRAKKNVKRGDGRCSSHFFFKVLERERDFALKYQEIRPSKSFGPRRKAILRGEDNAWAPVLWSFDKLREVWDLSYLGFTLCLSTLLMLELIEVVRGRLISPKSWDRNVRIFGARSA